MDVITAHDSFEDADIFGVTDLHEQISTPNFEVALQNMIAILRTPYDVRRESRDGVSTMSVIFHLHDF